MAVDDKEREEFPAEEVVAQYEIIELPRTTVNRAGGATPETMRRMIPGGVHEEPAAARSSGEPSSSVSGVKTSRAPSEEREPPRSSIGMKGPPEIYSLDFYDEEQYYSDPDYESDYVLHTVQCPSCQHETHLDDSKFDDVPPDAPEDYKVLFDCNCEERPLGCECTFRGSFEQYLPGDVEKRLRDRQREKGKQQMPEELVQVESKKERLKRWRDEWRAAAYFHQMEAQLRNPHDGASSSRGEAMEPPRDLSDVQQEPRGRPDVIDEEGTGRATEASGRKRRRSLKRP